ncbi:hypothetical protein M514_03101 [Trichuris suis]|uniref:Uncharacterized protein n=1 Tax=Trichuris suis TaxID=68888 RepID=A0A085NFM1_9BILA|nr:hypothetical protein M513_03101 [Trichuris suis]KFD68267.1 hypothetical protein M514_03101 [Trichuris suis]
MKTEKISTDCSYEPSACLLIFPINPVLFIHTLSYECARPGFKIVQYVAQGRQQYSPMAELGAITRKTMEASRRCLLLTMGRQPSDASTPRQTKRKDEKRKQRTVQTLHSAPIANVLIDNSER